MIFISHRGNIDSVSPSRENSTYYIDEAIALGYDVEVDVWFINNAFYLGHDKWDYPIDLSWLLDRKDKLWIHTKNFAALSNLIDQDLRIFYHKNEAHTIINNTNLIWSHDLFEANEKSIIPLISELDVPKFKYYAHVHGVCSDFIALLRK